MFVIFMAAIVAYFIINPQPDEYRHGHTNSQTTNIDQPIHFVSVQISPGDFEIVLNHIALIDDKSNTGENEKGCIMKANLFPTHRFPLLRFTVGLQCEYSKYFLSLVKFLILNYYLLRINEIVKQERYYQRNEVVHG